MKALRFKRRVALLVCCDLLLAALILAGIVARAPRSARALRLAELAVIDQVVELGFSGGTEPIVLRRHAEGWSIVLNGREFPAAEGKIENFIRVYREAAILRLAAEGPDRWSEFGTGDDQALRLRIRRPDRDVELVLGHVGRRIDELYVRMVGSNSVHLVDGGLAYYALQDSAYWSELRIFDRRFEARDLISISVEGILDLPDGRTVRRAFTLSLDAASNRWLRPDDPSAGPVESARVYALADVLALLSGDSFVTDGSFEALRHPGLVISMVDRNGTTYSLMIARRGSSAADHRIVSRLMDGAPDLSYRLSAAAYERLSAAVDALADT